MQNYPGIFNDVIGPVMRGPSSSHTAASWRIARCCLDILDEPLKKAVIDFDRDGAWAPNYREQGTTIGIEGGLLGLEMADDRMKNTEQLAAEMSISINYEVNSFPTKHVNTVRLKLEGTRGKKVQIVAASLGGGSFEIQQIGGVDVSIRGDIFELLIKPDRLAFLADIKSILRLVLPFKAREKSSNKNGILLNFKYTKEISAEVVEKLRKKPGCEQVIIIRPVLPIVSGNETDPPFGDVDSLLKYAEKEELSLGELGLIYEKCISGLSEKALLDKMKNLVGIIENSIKTGLKGTEYSDRILPQQSHLIGQAAKKGNVLRHSIVNSIVANVSAIMESKSALEVVVANPTAGSCGAVGGVLRAVADDVNATSEKLMYAYLAAGMVGAYVAKGPGFSAEEHGCQVECGASAGMAAAGIAQLFGGSAKQAIGAASMAIQNMIGLICDPVADRVEVPCLGKNVSAAMNALSSATMACSDFDSVIPLDEVIQTVSRVSLQMPSCVKCTGRGGLAITKTACQLKEKLTDLSAM